MFCVFSRVSCLALSGPSSSESYSNMSDFIMYIRAVHYNNILCFKNTLFMPIFLQALHSSQQHICRQDINKHGQEFFRSSQWFCVFLQGTLTQSLEELGIKPVAFRLLDGHSTSWAMLIHLNYIFQSDNSKVHPGHIEIRLKDDILSHITSYSWLRSRSPLCTHRAFIVHMIHVDMYEL